VNVQTGFAGNMKVALFTDIAGAPGTVPATSNVLNNPITGNNTFTFASPPSVTKGLQYCRREP
jgi:hypothetical protein